MKKLLVILVLFASTITAYANFAQSSGAMVAVIYGDAFKAGDSFDVVLGIENNPGFAAMSARIFIPEGLVLTHAFNLSFQGLAVTMPDGHHPPTGELRPPIVGPGFAFVTTFGTADFTTPNADLVRYTFKVAENAPFGETTPITFAFADINNLFLPRTADGIQRNIALPGGGSGIIGGIRVMPDLSPLHVSASPSHKVMENTLGYSVNFTVTVGGLRPEHRYCFENPDIIPGITFEGIPDGVEVSGYIKTDETGAGSGILTLTIRDTETEWNTTCCKP